MDSASSPFNIGTSRWPRGSEWRRWDLHVHTPESRLGSPFGQLTWVEYIDALEKAATEANISVIGVTDYMTIDGYEKIYAEKHSNGRMSTVDLLIPNIELRMMPPTSDGKALNLHLLIDPTEPDHIDEIKRALRNLKFEYSGQLYGCFKEDLIRFGRIQNPGITNDEAAYVFGIQQFKPDRTVIKAWLDKEQWLRNNSLIGIANGKDGISGLPVDSFGAIRDEVLRWCHFVFSGNPRDREHYLGHKTGSPKEAIIRQYRSLKPCIHGSDAHEASNLFKPDHDRFCWIKSDPTFHGLRQIIWEPEDRVHIGTKPPQPSDRSQQIRKISIEKSEGWFDVDSIELNSGLVAIIGEKGSGKTAIADLIAFASGYPIDRKSTSSFISKGSKYLFGTGVDLLWGSDELTSGTLTDNPFKTQRPRVRYLSQDFVERLCSSDHEGTELQTAIEEVVFSKLDEVQKEGYSSFSELRKAREAASNIQKESLRGELATLNKEVERLQESIDQRASKVSLKAEVEKQVEELKKQMPEATQLVDQKILFELETQQTQLKAIEEQISNRSRRRRTIDGVIESYRTLRRTTEQELAILKKELLDAGVPEVIASEVMPGWSSQIEILLDAEIKSLDNEISGLIGTDRESESPPSIINIQANIAALKGKVAEDEVSRNRLLDLQKQIADRITSGERLAKEIQNLDEKVTKNLEKQKSRQIELYLEVFTALSADEEGLRELYSPLQVAINELGEEMQFSVSVGYQIDAKSWLDRAARFFDMRRVGAESKRQEMEKIIETKLVPAWKSGTPSAIETAITELAKEVDVQSFPDKFGTSKLSRVELSDWLYSVDHIELSYKILYSGTELEYLSPGTRGIALLVLYLLMDEDDTRPLLIDQPEGNLDNSSIYMQLVPYIRKAKKRRQIILISHNPNLVVATDAEQIIIASAERSSTQQYPRFHYNSGGLEYSAIGDKLGIREAVCLLLEGGEEAFKARENRYSLVH